MGFNAGDGQNSFVSDAAWSSSVNVILEQAQTLAFQINSQVVQGNCLGKYYV